jgi:hypothetical protein
LSFGATTSTLPFDVLVSKLHIPILSLVALNMFLAKDLVNKYANYFDKVQ